MSAGAARNRGASAGIFVALAFAAALVGACGVLLESALRAHAPVERYGAAAAAVTGPQSVEHEVERLGEAPAEQSRPLAERSRVPVAAAAGLRAVPGVRDVVADVSFPVLLSSGGAVTGHGWESAALLPDGLGAGRAPRAADEVVLSRSAGVPAGGTVLLHAGGTSRPYKVTGLLTDGLPAAYFTAATAAALYGHPAQADALVVLGGTVDEGALRAAAPGLTVATGAARGDAEDPAVAAARPDIVDIAASFGSVAVMAALVVVGGLIVLSVRERAREFALLRAVGATPRQVRGRLLREMAGIGVPATLTGGVLSLALGAGMHAAMVGKGVLPDGFDLSLSPLPVLAAVAVTLPAALAAAFLASLRASRIRPVEALGEAAAEPAGLPRRRLVTGVVFLVIGLNALGFSATATGPTAATSLGGLVMALIVATALLGPLIARFGNRVLGRAARAVSPVAGRMAQDAAGAAALRAGSLITPVALAVAFAGVQLFAQTTIAHATEVQADDGNRADQVVVASGPGLAPGVAEAVRRTPGVTAATPVKHATVVMPVEELGEETLRSLNARGVGADAAATMDPAVSSGRLGDLGDGTVALSRDVAAGHGVGSTATLWLGDGTKVDARVVAVYDRGLGFGDVLLPHATVNAHSSSPLDDQVLVRGDGDLGTVAAAYPGVRVSGPDAAAAALSRDLRLQGFVGQVVVAAITGFVVIGLVTTLALATAARRREFALLRLVGATRGQVLRMLRLEAAIVLGTGIAAGALIAGVTLPVFAVAVAGVPLPAVSPGACAAVLAGVAGSGTAAITLPARAVLRRRTSPSLS
ncbi:FtsX-like permease family protein [Actinomadura sp. KC345]|uniref:ABC transporter permease n=1 Tax=Actinomadura sp. KC345 TaxID=2530371 RepID=UPI00104616A0|nr:ABC transporter permease [Actinomadura sp. KC345]TDC45686.1 FtsX-like permease family protein [Actinomadura sp. KC345]